MLQELIKAFALIFAAEMGDKTQILAMAFATRYSVKKVLLGIFLGAFLNHGLAVALGSYISRFVPINTIQIIAGFAFVGFALWTLKSEDGEEEEEEHKGKFGPVITVALAFFIGELGDKTQLTAITLAADAAYPVFILCGTVLGMIVTGGIGIFIGRKIGDKIPENIIKVIASAVFMFFGVTKLYQTLPDRYITLPYILSFAAVVSILLILLLRPMLRRYRLGMESLLKVKSRELYQYYRQAQKDIDGICLGEGTCGACQGNHCIIGYTKSLIRKGLEQEGLPEESFLPIEETWNKQYDQDRVSEALSLTLNVLKAEPTSKRYATIQEIRRKLETIIFKTSIDQMEDWEEYQRQLRQIDNRTADKVFAMMK